jgi:membrane protein YdbS with pleckstrin-like domain
LNKPVESVLVHLFKVPVGPPAPPVGNYARVEVLRASPRYLTYKLLGVGCGGVLVAFVMSLFVIAALASGKPVVLLGVVAVLCIGGPILLCAYLATRIDYDLRYYVMTDRSLRVREGAWVVDEKTITYANVQNVRVTQGPLQRMFKISDVRVDTAGGASGPKQHDAMGGHNIVIAGIEDANAVRDQILEHLRLRGVGAGLGDLDDERAASGGARFSPAHLEVLREIAAGAHALRAAAEQRKHAS